jgi:hypothetical protein
MSLRGVGVNTVAMLIKIEFETKNRCIKMNKRSDCVKDKNECEKIIDIFMEQYGRNANERDLDTYLYEEFTYGELKQYLDYFGTCGKR